MLVGRPDLYPVQLTSEQIAITKQILYQNKGCETIKQRANVLMGLDQMSKVGMNKGDIGCLLNVSNKTVYNISKLFFEGGLDEVFTLKRSPCSNTAQTVFDLRTEVLLLTMLCGPPPKGRSSWTTRLAAEELSHLFPNEKNFSHTTVWRAMQKLELKPHKSEYWNIPELTPEFIYRMEDILSVYERPYNPKFPLICMDECALQLLKEIKDRLPMKPGATEKLDSVYSRLGVRDVFMFVEPLRGIFYADAQKTRTAIDWAYQIKYLTDVLYPDAEKIVLVMDNLNTHLIESLYKAFAPEEAKRIVDRLEIHYTPVHGSWLNMAEIAINIMKREAIPVYFKKEATAEELDSQLIHWMNRKNTENKAINWNLTVEKNRKKNPSLYNLPAEFSRISSTEKFLSQNNIDDVNFKFSTEPRAIENQSVNIDGPIIDLVACMDEQGKVYFDVARENDRIILSENTGKNVVAEILGKRKTRAEDGWIVPVCSMPKNSKSKDIALPKADYTFMAWGEQVVDAYNRKYDSRFPVICIQKSSYDCQELTGNTWLLNLKEENLEKKRKSKKNDDLQPDSLNDNLKDDTNQVMPEEDDGILNDESKKIMSDNNCLNSDENDDHKIGITFMTEPLTGKKFFLISDNKDQLSWAEAIAYLVNKEYPEAEKITLLVPENKSSLISTIYQRYPPEEASRILNKVETIKIPSSAAWLNISELESITFLRGCLKIGINNIDSLAKELKKWKQEYPCGRIKINLQSFRTIFSDVYKLKQ